MGRVLVHLKDAESKGTHLLASALDDAHADTTTKAWIQNLTGQEVKQQKSGAPRRVSAVYSA